MITVVIGQDWGGGGGGGGGGGRNFGGCPLLEV